MYGEYGYMEEGDLGKPYNLRLLRRLARYGRPYARVVSLALFITVIVTLAELALPYLSKVAIDRYILSSWTMIRLSSLGKDELKDFLKMHGSRVLKSPDGALGFISDSRMKGMDPARIHAWRQKGILSAERYYRLEGRGSGRPPGEPRERLDRDTWLLADGSRLIPFARLDGLAREEILRVRAGDIQGVALVAAALLALLFFSFGLGYAPVSYTHLTLPTNREV